MELLPSEARRSQLISLSATQITKAAITSVLYKIRKGDETLLKAFDYESIGSDIPRLPSLRQYDAEQLYNLIALQRHCSVVNEKYQDLKPFVEYNLAEKVQFENLWNNIKAIRKEFDCSKKLKHQGTCENIF